MESNTYHVDYYQNNSEQQVQIFFLTKPCRKRVRGLAEMVPAEFVSNIDVTVHKMAILLKITVPGT